MWYKNTLDWLTPKSLLHQLEPFCAAVEGKATGKDIRIQWAIGEGEEKFFFEVGCNFNWRDKSEWGKFLSLSWENCNITKSDWRNSTEMCVMKSQNIQE